MKSTEIKTGAVESRRQSLHTWFGCLADDNIEHVAQRIRNLLTGRRYTWVAYNVEHVTYAFPEVRTGQRLAPQHTTDGEALRVHRIGEPQAHSGKPWTTAGLSASDTYGAWGLHTSYATEAEARADQHEPDRRHRVTYLRIEGGTAPDDIGSQNRIEIRHCNYMNPPEMLVWIIAVDTGDEDS